MTKSFYKKHDRKCVFYNTTEINQMSRKVIREKKDTFFFKHVFISSLVPTPFSINKLL